MNYINLLDKDLLEILVSKLDYDTLIQLIQIIDLNNLNYNLISKYQGLKVNNKLNLSSYLQMINKLTQYHDRGQLVKLENYDYLIANVYINDDVINNMPEILKEIQGLSGEYKDLDIEDLKNESGEIDYDIYYKAIVRPIFMEYKDVPYYFKKGDKLYEKEDDYTIFNLYKKWIKKEYYDNIIVFDINEEEHIESLIEYFIKILFKKVFYIYPQYIYKMGNFITPNGKNILYLDFFYSRVYS